MKTCKICGRKYQYNRQAGHTMEKCNSCSVNQRRTKLKKKMLKYRGEYCQNCGYNKCPESLCFHHIDPLTKSFNLSGAHCRSWKNIQIELDKCITLCQNCHHELHAGYWKFK